MAKYIINKFFFFLLPYRLASVSKWERCWCPKITSSASPSMYDYLKLYIHRIFPNLITCSRPTGLFDRSGLLPGNRWSHSLRDERQGVGGGPQSERCGRRRWEARITRPESAFTPLPTLTTSTLNYFSLLCIKTNIKKIYIIRNWKLMNP